MSDKTQHTPGPWYADRRGHIWRRPPSELHEYGGDVAGDKPLAAVSRGWYGEDASGYPVEANARLIAESPVLLALVEEGIELWNSPNWRPSQTAINAWLTRARAAVAKARGGER